MKTLSKRSKIARNLILKKTYSIEEGITLLKQTATTKFIESAEAHFCLNIDTKYSDQQLRTTITLPKGTGKSIKVALLVSDDSNNDVLLNEGADLVGSDDLIEDISKGNLNFDLLLTTPDMMPRLTKLGKMLGPRGLMPSTKAGTISTDLVTALKEFKAGKVECRADKTGVVHILFGKTNFLASDLEENFLAIYEAIKQNRPSGVKGKYLKTITICTTMGPGISIDISTLP
uniref:Large ribosomal subunit protein uL1c n=1 Tax=Aureoumbra lagunensis TaxID=44058 RepID=C6KJ07_9STRA|nr:50S ribosomal protein L1 [Aureoumbra lagunensis]ACS36963.1 50S ribosomal protein L1 [Aureoumbra lagunensis]